MRSGRPPIDHERRATSGGRILAFDTATTLAVVAVGDQEGRPLAQSRWQAGYRHGEELLSRVDAVLQEAGAGLTDLVGIVVGTGPGAFTGLRVGLATAKGLARGLGIPLVGVPIVDALGGGAVLLPAGPTERVLVVEGTFRRLGPADTIELPRGTPLRAIDLEGRAPEAATVAGGRALAALGAMLLRIGASRLADGKEDDLARLVPEYVTLPRGVAAVSGEVTWSRARR